MSSKSNKTTKSTGSSTAAAISVEVDITPHPNLLRTAGKSHFSRIADACAEFIDNSIQATSKQDYERHITVQLQLFERTKNGNEGYLIVYDNGQGMNTKGLTEFGTYAYDKESRGERGSAEDVSFISKVIFLNSIYKIS